MDYAIIIEEPSLDELDESISKIHEYAKAGATLITIPFSKTTNLELFSKDVIPTL